LSLKRPQSGVGCVAVGLALADCVGETLTEGLELDDGDAIWDGELPEFDGVDVAVVLPPQADNDSAPAAETNKALRKATNRFLSITLSYPFANARCECEIEKFSIHND
jgi:hypothetical protein